VGNLATAARCPARPSDIDTGVLVVGVELTIGGGLVMGVTPLEESCWANSDGCVVAGDTVPEVPLHGV